MIRTLLIANRGEIACRIMRTARRMGIRSVAVFSEADAHSRHVMLADEAHPIGPARATDSYLRGDRILAVAKVSGAQAIHPGYGFLSENAEFADACAAAGVVFIGPPPGAIRAMGSKAESKRLMEQAGVPIVPGFHGEAQDEATLIAEAARIGFPVLIKASAGGGGKGMRPVYQASEFAAQLGGARREAKAAFGDDRVLLERYLQKPRHVEVQVVADTQGNTIHLHTRDCSVQRRHQKVLEEAPAPDLPTGLRARLHEAAIAAARAVGYVSAGTVEFIVEGNDAFFMEMNTRLQVEHPVTEMVTGFDLVEWQLRVANGEALPSLETPPANGHSVEVRLYAEDPAKEFRPMVGTVQEFDAPETMDKVRVDKGIKDGDAITPHYDPMIAKLIAWGEDRTQAFRTLAEALARTRVTGLTTNLEFLRRLVLHPAMLAAELDTGFLARHREALVPAARPAPRSTIAAAVSILLGQEAAHANGDSPWSRRDGWRLQGAAERILVLGDGEVEHSLRLRQAAGATTLLFTEGPSLAVMPAEAASPGSAFNVGFDGIRERVGYRQGRESFELTRGGPEAGSWILSWHDPYAPADSEAAGQGRLSAPIPGRVVQVLVAVGEAVSRGQVLAVLEAMKTELRITAPLDGVVAHIGCVVGDSVEEGTELITLATAD